MTALGDIAIRGGGCYGAFYAGQLEAARDRGVITYRRLLVVDHDPACKAAQLPDDPARELRLANADAFLDAWFDERARDRDGLADQIVPTPMMPHLMADWLRRQAQAIWPERIIEMVPVESPLGTPFDHLHPSGVRFVSFADWLCPMHCVEPLRCPVIHAPRSWEMGDAIAAWAERNGIAGTALFTCRHVAFGVGMYPAASAFAARATLRAIGTRADGGDLVIGSVSACHGAMAVLRIGAARARVDSPPLSPTFAA